MSVNGVSSPRREVPVSASPSPSLATPRPPGTATASASEQPAPTHDPSSLPPSTTSSPTSVASPRNLCVDASGAIWISALACDTPSGAALSDFRCSFTLSGSNPGPRRPVLRTSITNRAATTSCRVSIGSASQASRLIPFTLVSSRIRDVISSWLAARRSSCRTRPATASPTPGRRPHGQQAPPAAPASPSSASPGP